MVPFLAVPWHHSRYLMRGCLVRWIHNYQSSAGWTHQKILTTLFLAIKLRIHVQIHGPLQIEECWLLLMTRREGLIWHVIAQYVTLIYTSIPKSLYKANFYTKAGPILNYCTITKVTLSNQLQKSNAYTTSN